MKTGKIALNRNKIALLKSIMEEIPPELELATIEFEGPFIVIYVRNRTAIAKHLDLAQNIARKVRKRVVLRVSSDGRLPPDQAKQKILEIAPKDAGVDPNGIYFDEASGEVWVKVQKPGFLVGRGSVMRHYILAETGWRVVPQRASPLESKALKEIMGNLLRQGQYRLEFMRSLGERIHRDVIFKNNYVRITGLGGFREVGRSAILVETRESKILLDLGINTGKLHDQSGYPMLDIDSFRLDEFDGVIVTHAHLDHVGLVPLLYKYGYRGPVYVTKPTRELMVIMLKDLVEVSRRSGKYIPFSEKDIATMLLHTITVDYEEVTDVAPDIKLTMYNAGHILGSAIVHLHIGMGLHNIVYTGDFKYADSRLLGRANTSFPRVETLIMEGTYGAQLQQSRAQAEEELINIIKRTAERQGVVLIPVFAVGRGQEILLILNEAIEKGLLPKDLTIYVEGLVNEVTAIHTQYPEYLNRNIREAIYNGENPFVSDNIRIIEGDIARPDIVEDRPSVIVATSGMLTGGPAVDYLTLIAGDPRCSLVFVGYQAEGTLGRTIKDGARELTMVVENKIQVLKIGLEVYSIDGFSGHSDQRELLNYVRDISPKPNKIILNHGEPNALTTLQSLITKSSRALGYHTRPEVLVPDILESVNLTA